VRCWWDNREIIRISRACVIIFIKQFNPFILYSAASCASIKSMDKCVIPDNVFGVVASWDEAARKFRNIFRFISARPCKYIQTVINMFVHRLIIRRNYRNVCCYAAIFTYPVDGDYENRRIRAESRNNPSSSRHFILFPRYGWCADLKCNLPASSMDFLDI